MEVTEESKIPENPQTEEVSQETDPVNSAALLFKMYYPRFSRELNTLSVKSLRRLIRAWVGVPLEEAMPNFKNSEESVAYAVGERLLEAKMVVTLHTLYQHSQQIQSAEENSPECTTTTSTPTETPSASV
jgi:hypothetical protein